MKSKNIASWHLAIWQQSSSSSGSVNKIQHYLRADSSFLAGDIPHRYVPRGIDVFKNRERSEFGIGLVVYIRSEYKERIHHSFQNGSKHTPSC
jgi:hypothetical protein